LGRSFSFSALAFLEERSQLPSSLAESLRVFEILRLLGALETPSAGLAMREVRFEESVGKNDLFVSSSLSDGRLDGL
jgi:hypothetical protein